MTPPSVPGGPDRLLYLGATAYSPAAGLLFDRSRCGQGPTPALLEPAAYGAQAQPVSAGGRGSAWFVAGAFGQGVLRQFRRGGLLGRLWRTRYVWLGVERTRCVREYRLLRALHDQGLPVPAPLAAGWWRAGLFYRQALLTQRLPGTRPLSSWLRDQPHDIPWAAIGQLLARCQRAGIYHADLNAHNILIDSDLQPWLIDFDRGWQRPALTPAQARSMQQRLRRSLRKVAGEQGEAAWQALAAVWLPALADA